MKTNPELTYDRLWLATQWIVRSTSFSLTLSLSLSLSLALYYFLFSFKPNFCFFLFWLVNEGFYLLAACFPRWAIIKDQLVQNYQIIYLNSLQSYWFGKNLRIFRTKSKNQTTTKHSQRRLLFKCFLPSNIDYQ